MGKNKGVDALSHDLNNQMTSNKLLDKLNQNVFNPKKNLSIDIKLSVFSKFSIFEFYIRKLVLGLHSTFF